jgi:hypothetical protein
MLHAPVWTRGKIREMCTEKRRKIDGKKHTNRLKRRAGRMHSKRADLSSTLNWKRADLSSTLN